MILVDFKKAYDSIDRQTLFNVLEEFRIDRKMNSNLLEIKTGVRQGDSL